MAEDPIVAEVRKAREEYAARFNHDVDAMIRDLQEKTRKSGRRVVSLPPRRIQPEKASATEQAATVR
jgi:hypothetical protein